MSQLLENGDEDERISEPVRKKVQKRVFDMEQKLHLIHYQENNPKLSYSKIAVYFSCYIGRVFCLARSWFQSCFNQD